MARALRCPGCGTNYPVTSLPDTPAFRCQTCGTALRVPAQFRPHAAVDLPPAPLADAAPAPARSGRYTTPREHTSVYQAPGALQPRPGTAASPAFQAQVPPPPRRTSAAPRSAPPWWLTTIAWLVALPLGLFLVVYPARKLGFLSGQRLVDVIVGTGWSRYWRVLAIAPMWALVTTIIVQLILYLGRSLSRRRRRVAAERAEAGPRRRGRGAPAAVPPSPSTNGAGPSANRRSVQRGRTRRS